MPRRPTLTKLFIVLTLTQIPTLYDPLTKHSSKKKKKTKKTKKKSQDFTTLWLQTFQTIQLLQGKTLMETFNTVDWLSSSFAWVIYLYLFGTRRHGCTKHLIKVVLYIIHAAAGSSRIMNKTNRERNIQSADDERLTQQKRLKSGELIKSFQLETLKASAKCSQGSTLQNPSIHPS